MPGRRLCTRRADTVYSRPAKQRRLVAVTGHLKAGVGRDRRDGRSLLVSLPETWHIRWQKQRRITWSCYR